MNVSYDKFIYKCSEYDSNVGSCHPNFTWSSKKSCPINEIHRKVVLSKNGEINPCTRGTITIDWINYILFKNILDDTRLTKL